MNRNSDTAALSRSAGLLYLAIIIAGIGAEIGLRAPLVVPGDPAATAVALTAAPMAIRLSLLLDLSMALCDAGLAVVLFALFRPVAPLLALAAMVFRLVQTALVASAGLHLLALSGALASGMPPVQAMMHLDLHADDYNLALAFFAVNALITAAVLWRSGLRTRGIALGLVVAGLVYLGGAALRVLAPDIAAAFAPAYLVCLVAESAFCLRLLIGVGRAQPVPRSSKLMAMKSGR